MQNLTPQNGKSRRTNQITISLHPGLLEMVDKAAAEEFTTRSDVIRTALLWYLRPHGRDLKKADPEFIVKTLQRRKARAELNKFLKENEDGIDVYDT